MHEPLLAQAALPAPVKVLGLTLKPYSLGHELFLIREGNPLVTTAPESAKPHDIAEAALVCCQTFEECRRMHRDRWIGLKLKLWRRRIRRADYDLARAAFLEYRNAGSIEFPLSDIARPDKPTSRAPGAPFLLRLHQFLMAKLHKTEAEAWDYPLGLAKCHWECFWESEGGLDIYNAADAEFDRFVAEQEAKAKEAVNG